mmetsp:Transcript_68798/g.192919  ORF Transcript_68798/g.192919 Transcript_68798/m.192919 type:complete len:345 (-) Transcript_68798:73-1107(-)|eukprot:CAMPEP_0176195392 /NCGR_PEP_ID=MMETSP0121_2-20121125/6489_1 /TAXON_ID=160619 /ORGANISM="Kryptoperidinium foliaceum, Strain CCMP 1326" /LENGTH=344 /DNA_ID=CAMNT_0017534161 /DNA_START=67 /DNA_END=1101 /DNA_ORIENTATION=-
MLRFTVSLAIAVMCWSRSSFGFIPSSGRPVLSPSPRLTLMRYSDVLLEEQREQLKSRLPPVDQRQMSKLEIEFRELLKAMLYTPQEMSSITNPRFRVIFEGVAASYYEPAVYRAFEVLYEDYMPLRIAGRLIHGKLQKIMDESKEYQQDQFRSVLSKTGFPLETVGRTWESYVQIAGDRELSVEWVETILCRGQEIGIISPSEQDIMTVVNPDQRGSLSFDEIVDGCLALSPDLTTEGLQELFQIFVGAVPPSSGIDEKRAKYSQRYDNMLVKFGEWKSFIPSGEGRRLDILKGCFKGSENPQVVAALRVIYTDYPALRMSGDWIFQVVSTLMNATMKRRQRDT